MSGSQSVRKVQAEKREWIRQYKAERGCARCPENDPACLDLHHRNPDQKNPKLRGLVRGTLPNLGWDELQTEVYMCDVICANCHRKLHVHDPKPSKSGSKARKRELRAAIERIGRS